MASNNQKCVWVYAVGYELVHYFQTAEEADVWWASYKVEVGDDVEGAIEQVFQKLPPSPTTTPDETEELDVEKLEFEGNTYLKDDDENVYNYDLTEVEKIGVWDEQNKRIVFDDDKRTTEEKEEEFCWEIDCDVCGELQGKDDCPFETGYADDEYICDECFMCCEECSGSKNPVFGARARATGWVCECEDVDDEHNRCIDCDDHLPRTKKTFWGCEECGLNTCEECCENDDGYVMCAGCVRKQKEVCMCVRDCACV